MQFVYAVALSSGSYDSYNYSYLCAYSTREAAIEQIQVLATEMLKFESEYKKTMPRAKFSVSFEQRGDLARVSVSETSSWGGGSRLPALNAMCKHMQSSQVGQEFYPELWSQSDPFDGDFSLEIEALPLMK